jgi:hypothetical protein
MSQLDVHEGRADVVGYSSRVRLDLIVNSQTIPLAQMGPDHVVLAAPVEVAAGPAETTLHVDGVPRRWSVEILPHDPGTLRLPIRRHT